jgi:hypothetical protein
MDFAKLIERAKNICLSPKAEWQKIAAESATTGSLFTGYAMILAAIPAICGFIGMTMIGMSMPFVGTIRTGVGPALVQLIVGYVLGLLGVFILSLIINALAPTFDGQKDPVAALKVAVYSYTPSWLAGILMIVPLLGILVFIAAIYGIYLLYLGLPVLMKSPAEKSVGYTALIVVCAIVLGIVMGLIITAVAGTGAMMAGGLR